MADLVWKARLEALWAATLRDLGDMARQAKLAIAGLDTSERLVLAGLGLMGLFYMLMSHIKGRHDGEQAARRFAGLLFAFMAVAAGFGWSIAGRAA